MVNAWREDYVRAIFLLSAPEGGSRPARAAHYGEVGVRSKQLSGYLHVSKNTVSEMLNRLKSAGLVNFEHYGPISLTAKGRKLARALTARHRLIELFLARVLKRKPSAVHDEACRLEHEFSQESIDAMKKLLKNPTLDPHGEPIYV
ncbi:MAG: metal-dependent transcriptional regulator [Candidatus Micrarchaeia archaeon]|jgi:DtxR family Mn-dependent transcriptional regulator